MDDSDVVSRAGDGVQFSTPGVAWIRFGSSFAPGCRAGRSSFCARDVIEASGTAARPVAVKRGAFPYERPAADTNKVRRVAGTMPTASDGIGKE